MAGWELIRDVVRNLGAGWQVDASGLQNLGQYAGLASGPAGMKLLFIARTEKLSPSLENSCPPLGWLRVDGRLHFTDKDLSAKLSITLAESLAPEEIANQIKARLFPVYQAFLNVIDKQGAGGQSDEHRHAERPEAPKRERLTEQKAASYFVRAMLEQSARGWPKTYETLRECLGKKFVVEDEDMACHHWSLAAISLGLQGVRNSFPREQARRIEEWIFRDMDDEWAIDEVKQYDAAFQEGREIGPLGGVPGRLLYRWLGKNIRNCEAEVDGKRTGFVDALVSSMADSALAGLTSSWSWKKISDTYELVEKDAILNQQPNAGSVDESSLEISDEDIPF